MTTANDETPPPETQRLWETPIKTKNTESGFYRGATNVPDARDAMVKDLEASVVKLPIQVFKEYILPKVPDIDIAKTQKAVKSKNCVSEEGWVGFPEPSTNTEREEPAFSYLKDVYMNISDNVKFKSKRTPARTPTLEYTPCGSFTPYSDRDNNSRPDGFGLLTNTQSIATSYIAKNGGTDGKNWLDIAFADEYKKKNDEKGRFDNQKKLLWSMHHILRNDPRRRFTYGLTIENTTTRMWFCCRQVVLVSTPFDFMKDHDIFIHIAISLLYGTTTELGWDPTFQLTKKDNKWFYDITVHHKQDGKNEPDTRIYRAGTEDLLFSYAADSIRGRATRVYKAFPLNNRGEMGNDCVLIKDLWIDHDREREGNILQNISQGAEKWNTEKEYFLTHVASGDVYIDGQNDNTEITIMRGLRINDAVRKRLDSAAQTRDNQNNAEDDINAIDFSFCTLESPAQKKKTQASQSVGLHKSANVVPWSPQSHRQFHPKVHHRIVFAEVGIPLEDLVSNGASMTVLLTIWNDIIKALKVMHYAGYVHRDVTPSNIIVVNSRGKLIDLEHSKKIGTEGHHDVRTVTGDFIALETAAQKYVFVSYPSDWCPFDKSLVPPFVYNPLHDMESMWWILLYFCVFYALDKPLHSDTYPLSMESALRQRILANEIFAQTSDNVNRERIFHLPQKYQELGGLSFPVLTRRLFYALTALRAAYSTAERDLHSRGLINTEAFKGIHDTISNIIVADDSEESHKISLCHIDVVYESYNNPPGPKKTS